MADGYDKLLEDERSYWNIYTRLRMLSDWDGFSHTQEQVRADARDWLGARRKEIFKSAESEKDGWDKLSRRARFAQLKVDHLNSGSPQLLCQLPTATGTPNEKALISEREMWWRVGSVDKDTKMWRQANVDSLIEIRKKLFSLGEDDGWLKLDRRRRYANLAVATKFSTPYKDWVKTHDVTTGEHKNPEQSPRAKFVSNCRSFLGTHENPPNSNKGNPEPSKWQRRVFGRDGVPWCACFITCMAWDAAASGSSSASVSVIVDMATRGQGIFRGFTRDPKQVRRGDFAVISCRTCHIAGVVDNNDPNHTIEGNTSPGDEGSQFNGGTVAERHRQGQIFGWALVDYPD